MTGNIQETVKHGVDGIAGFVTLGAIVEFLPPLAALFTIIWTGIRIYVMLRHRIDTGKWK